jgi:hypothetical protein
MQRSYLVKSPVHFADFGFFVKVGDILVHDTANANRLTVYRNGAVVKAVEQTTLGIAAMVKSEFIQEVVQPAHKAAPKTAPKQPSQETPKQPAQKPQGEPKPLPKPPAKKREEPRSYTAEEYTPAVKRGKAQGVEVSTDELPERLKQALALPRTPEIDDETI